MESIISKLPFYLENNELDELEVRDRSLLKRIFSAPNSTPTAAQYLETGWLTIRTIIKARRLNYLQYLVKLPNEDMLSRFFHCQWLNINQHDWTKQIRVDLEDLDIPADLDLIGGKSVFSWKNVVKKKPFEHEGIQK